MFQMVLNGPNGGGNGDIVGVVVAATAGELSIFYVLMLLKLGMLIMLVLSWMLRAILAFFAIFDNNWLC